MAQFFSYPFNYIQAFTGDANKLSQKSLEDLVTSTETEDTKKVDFNFEIGPDKIFQFGFNINAVQIISENVEKVSLGTSELEFLSNPKFLVQRGGLLFSINMNGTNSSLCSLDLTGQYINTIGSISSSKTFDGFAVGNQAFWLRTRKMDNTPGLYKFNISIIESNNNNEIDEDNIIELQNNPIESGPITFHKNELYMIINSGLYTINLSNGAVTKKSKKIIDPDDPNLTHLDFNNPDFNNPDSDPPGPTYSPNEHDPGDLDVGTIKHLTSLNGTLYLTTQNGSNIKFYRIKSIPDPNPIRNKDEKPWTGAEQIGKKSSSQTIEIEPIGLTGVGNHLYLIGNDKKQIYKIKIEKDRETNKEKWENIDIIRGKQYFFDQQFPPVNPANSNNRLSITFHRKDNSKNMKIYRILLLSKKIELRYSSPTPGIWNPHNSSGEIIQPSDFSQIEPVQIEQAPVIHRNVYGQRIKRNPYNTRSKYQISYTLPIRSLKQVQSLQRFRDQNLNFVFAQNPILYPDRIFPAHFSSFDLPINFISKTVAQSNAYTFTFTITEN